MLNNKDVNGRILSDIHIVTIGTMLNNNDVNDAPGLKIVTCKQTFTKSHSCALSSCEFPIAPYPRTTSGTPCRREGLRGWGSVASCVSSDSPDG